MKIDIIGKGNVGSHLYRAFSKNSDVALVNSRNLESLRKDCDIYIIAVADMVIKDVAKKLSENIHNNAVVVHTSGSTSLKILYGIYQHFGVFYPLQTFSKDVELNYLEIPLFLEASDDLTFNVLIKVAKLFSDKYRFIDSEQRKYLHIASVFSCNFINHLWTLSYEYLKEMDLSFIDLIPLIKETCSKIERISPPEAQTGPASRNDMVTIDSHVSQLQSKNELQDIYKILTASIMKRNN